MASSWPISRKILQIKGKMSYRELEEDIKRKTGKRIAFGALRQLACGISKGRPETIAILAEYTGKPLSWFYEGDDTQSTLGYVIDETEIITSGIYDTLRKTGINPDSKDLELLVNLVKVFVSKNKKTIRKLSKNRSMTTGK